MVLGRAVAAAMARKGLPLQEIIESLQKFASCKLAEEWDNVGLLIDPMVTTPIHTALLTNDLTEDVVTEATDAKAGLIISYHPNIFKPLKSVTSKTWKERIVVQCLRAGIAVFSPHTSWDVVQGGVNDWLSNAFTYTRSLPISVNSNDPTIGCGRMLTLKTPIAVGTAINCIKTHIGIPHLRLALARQKDQSSLISTVALCAGSGSSVLSGLKADLYLTGEMLHHDVLEATQNGTHVVLCNHSDSERGFLKVFQKKLQDELLNDQVTVLVSQIDKDPLTTV